MKFILEWASNHGHFAVGFLAAAAFAYVAWIRFMPRIHSRERMYAMDFPFPLCGRPDLVMQEWGGGLVIHDHKTRRSARVYDSDVLQLSLYAILVSSATKRRVASHGIVRAVDARGVETKIRVPLIGDAARLTHLHERFMEVANQPVLAQRNGPRHLCKQCGFHRKECPGSSRG